MNRKGRKEKRNGTQRGSVSDKSLSFLRGTWQSLLKALYP